MLYNLIRNGRFNVFNDFSIKNVHVLNFKLKKTKFIISVFLVKFYKIEICSKLAKHSILIIFKNTNLRL